MNNETNDLDKLKNMIKDIEFAILTTVSQDGSLHSRPMVNLKLVDFSGTLWFFSKRNSFKNHDIKTDQNVNLAYANPKNQQYVSVCGRAFVSSDKDKMKELWNPMLKAWFPEGLEDPEISLIGVNIETAEIWDSLGSSVVQQVGFFKSQVTGKPLDQKLNSQHIEVRH